ncbi:MULTISPECIES: hemagglutinin repeat-containing protein [Rodentibacter]|uniref:hemagglutinin repeat-containing protein n=1 Tax=Rodentibacter TaxID=1960084 RepID=UPI001CFC7551|nr:hemagglutinin repeat-containing protein [Rodentibacter sp. JRC1]
MSIQIGTLRRDVNVAAKAYSTYANAAAGGALLRVEAGTGYSHSRERLESKQAEAQGNLLNAQHIDIKSRRGDIRAKQTDFTSRDAEGKRLADSSIRLNAAKELVLESSQSTATQKGRQQSSGVEVGAGVAIGAQTGVYVYAQGGFSNSKQDERHLIQNNSHLDSESISLSSGGDTTLAGAVAKAKTIHTDVGGTLKIESRQDEHHSQSSSAGFGGRIQVSLGTGWGASGYGNASSGKSSSKQVAEQSGLFTEEGGYHINANHVQLKGGAIASANPNNSELKTNTLTFSDIKNESQSRAISGSISGSANLNKLGGVEAKTEEEAAQQAKISKLTGTPQSDGINPTIPLYASESDSSITKATLTEGKIILNKDSQPTETTAKALGINTELSQANSQVKATFDIQQKLSEQQVIGNAIGEIGAAAQAYTESKAKALNEEAEELAKAGKIAEAAQKKQEAEKWQTSGEHKRKVEAVTTALSLALAGKPTEAIAAGAASPYVNQAIKTLTAQSETANIAAHVLWGAIEAELSGGKASTGAISAATAELGARALTQGIYQKDPSELTPEEKEQVLEITKALAGVAAGAATKGNSAETLNAVSTGSAIAKNAVENNLFGYSPEVLNSLAQAEQAKQIATDVEKAAIEKFEKAHPELIENLKTTGNIAGFIADLTPVVGDAKSFVEAEDGIDYALATIGIIPGADFVTKPLKAAKVSIQKAKAAEKVGNIAEVVKHQQEAARYINNSVNGIYDSKELRKGFEEVYGKSNVKSTTVPPLNSKNVKLAGKKHPVTDVPFDNKGFPIFDDIAKYDTKIRISDFKSISYEEQMKLATQDLAKAIEKGHIDKNKFTIEQLDAIKKGKSKIPHLTWHHHQDTGRMQLINERIHSKTGHIGGDSIQKGK